MDVLKKVNKDFIIISCSDFIMRGYYFFEINLLKSEVERLLGKLF